ncbi:helicase-related protein, partial [Rhizobium ruizarguesonis]
HGKLQGAWDRRCRQRQHVHFAFQFLQPLLVLLSTTIVESGLDVPKANTLIVHRADMFGLAQLYQMRGRVGRSKVRALALFTLPVNKVLTA